MKVLIVNNNSAFIDDIVNILSPHPTTVISKQNFKAGMEKEFDAVILSGGRGE